MFSKDVLSKGQAGGVSAQCYGKIASAPDACGALWRDGRAAEGACLENMFGSHQRGFESHSLRHPTSRDDSAERPVGQSSKKVTTHQIGEVPEWSNGAAC